MKFFDLNLPVFRVGDDLQYWLDETKGDAKLAFKKLAGQYEEAAIICKRMANVMAEYEDIQIESANYYNILVSGLDSSVGGLVSDGILFGPEEEQPQPDVEMYDEEDDLYPEELDESYCFERGYD